MSLIFFARISRFPDTAIHCIYEIMNRLANERSAYLRHSAHQKVDWYPWSNDAFDKARREDKPVFLSSGAVWCHWCHVMAKECFENDEIVDLMNKLFVCIKLDRDERPEIDRRYQQAVSAMGGGGGWPLSVFLLPDKTPFFGGTYFPPVDRNGRPGFKTVLKAVSDFYRLKKEDAATYGRQVLKVLKPEATRPGELRRSDLDDAVASILAQYDPEYGGFGRQPKFPMPGALEFLLKRSFFLGRTFIDQAVRRTLDGMAAGGFHDHLGGGFHRYSTDEAWIVPHFEKMADDNAWLLRNYIDAYAVYGDEQYREVAEGIIRFARDVLSDPEGGFYASQDADVTPNDEGGYFTWTEEDFKKALNNEEFEVLSLHFLGDRSAMHHDPAKKVLFVVMEPGEIAEKLGKDVAAVEEIIKRGKERLLKARSARQKPYVDTALYTSLNGMFIASFFRAFRVLQDPWIKEFALKSLERIMKERLVNGGLLHTEGVAAVLDDYVFLAEAFVAAYEVTAKERFLAQADKLMGQCVEKFYDHEGGGFFDTETAVLGTRLKRVEDIPHPSANAAAALLLQKLSFMTGKDLFLRAAEETLKTFSEPAMEMGIHAGSYFCALDAWFTMARLTVNAHPGSALAEAARGLAGPSTAVRYAEDRGLVLPCVGTSCHEPVTTPEGFRAFLAELRKA